MLKTPISNARRSLEQKLKVKQGNVPGQHSRFDTNNLTSKYQTKNLFTMTAKKQLSGMQNYGGNADDYTATGNDSENYPKLSVSQTPLERSQVIFGSNRPSAKKDLKSLTAFGRVYLQKVASVKISPRISISDAWRRRASSGLDEDTTTLRKSGGQVRDIIRQSQKSKKAQNDTLELHDDLEGEEHLCTIEQPKLS